MSVESCGISDPGCVRPHNEDRILLVPVSGLYAVCDGMGGHKRGEVAAELAITALRYYVDASRDGDVTWPFGYNFDVSLNANRLMTAIRLANREIWRRAGEELESAGMGTTIAAVLLEDARAVIANVGDSRVYHLRDKLLTQVTVDDTLVNSMAQRGLLNAQQLQNHPMRNLLSQAAGSQETIEVHVWEEQLEQGDVLLIASDGLHGVIGDADVCSILDSGDGMEQIMNSLVQAAKAAGAPDNVSIVLLRYS